MQLKIIKERLRSALTWRNLESQKAWENVDAWNSLEVSQLHTNENIHTTRRMKREDATHTDRGPANAPPRDRERRRGTREQMKYR